jgi:GNAT superfamily N-acetyltransferase
VLEAVTSPGATAAAIIEGTRARIPPIYLKGAPATLEPLLHELINRLRRDHGITEVHAGAPSDSLYNFYCQRMGMSLWAEIVTYERPVLNHVPGSKSAALVRPVTDADRGALLPLAGSAEHLANLTGLAAQYPSRFMVAEKDQTVAGYALSYRDGQVCQFKSLVVDPTWRRSGIGWDLTRDAVQWFDQLGLPSALRTQVDNQAARRLYEAFGYQPAGQIRMVHTRWGSHSQEE